MKWPFISPYLDICLSNISRPDVAFNFSRVPIREVNSHLKNLKRNKAVGLDNIPAGFLKDVANDIAPPLTHIINLSLRNGVIPSDLKSGRVTPCSNLVILTIVTIIDQ